MKNQLKLSIYTLFFPSPISSPIDFLVCCDDLLRSIQRKKVNRRNEMNYAIFITSKYNRSCSSFCWSCMHVCMQRGERRRRSTKEIKIKSFNDDTSNVIIIIVLSHMKSINIKFLFEQLNKRKWKFFSICHEFFIFFCLLNRLHCCPFCWPLLDEEAIVM